jgi:Arc/MetJ-type ribon-helix-helix transcriptional regulator
MGKQNSRRRFPDSIGVRLTANERSQVDELVLQGRFKDISQLTRQAIEKFLKENPVQ